MKHYIFGLLLASIVAPLYSNAQSSEFPVSVGYSTTVGFEGFTSMRSQDRPTLAEIAGRDQCFRFFSQGVDQNRENVRNAFRLNEPENVSEIMLLLGNELQRRYTQIRRNGLSLEQRNMLRAFIQSRPVNSINLQFNETTNTVGLNQGTAFVDVGRPPFNVRGVLNFSPLPGCMVTRENSIYFSRLAYVESILLDVGLQPFILGLESEKLRLQSLGLPRLQENRSVPLNGAR
jgi:hypothetical protein